MPHLRRCSLLLSALVIAACARASASLAPAAAKPPGADACARKLVSPADAAGLLAAPITRERAMDGDTQSCVFDASDFSSVTISLRPGLGDATLDSWLSGRMSLPVVRIAGVGDRAVWQPSLHEIIATRRGVLCDVGVMGPPIATLGATPQRVGALCSKIFAASRLMAAGPFPRRPS